MPASLSSIGEYVFYKCTNLKDVNITDLKAWCSIEGFDEPWAYPIYDTGNLYLNGILVTDLVIPDTVTKIAPYTFSGLNSLKSVTIPDSVISIGNSAFYDCSALDSVYITDLKAWCEIEFGYMPLSYVDNFYLNGNLVTDLVIPDSVTSISDYAFSHCGSLESVTIPDSVTSIGNDTFSYCGNLESVTIPDSVTSIGNHTFSYCDGLVSVTIPDSVTSIGDYTFSYCDGLESITIPDSVTSIGNYTFWDCDGLESLTIPDSVTSIGDSTFRGCGSLESVTIPDSVTSIGELAFSNCSNLVILCNAGSYAESYAKDNSISYRYIGDELPSGSCGENVTWSISSDMTLTMSGSGKMDGYSSSTKAPWSGYSDQIKAVTIGEGITNIGSNAFNGCTVLTSVTIPDSVTNIGTCAFYGCSSLASVDIPDSVTSIGERAFYRCTGLKNIALPDNLTSIYNYVFYGCSGLTNVTIPDSVTSIGASAFYACSGLTNVTVPDSVTSIGASAFYACSGLTNVTVPDSVTSIGTSAFYGCTELVVNCSVGSYAEGYAIDNGLFVKSDGEVYWCIQSGTLRVLCDGKMPDYEKKGTPWYPYYAGITAVKVEEGVTEIGDYAFYYCEQATDIHIPSTVTKIGYDAFFYCNSRTSIYITDLEAWSKIEYESMYSNPLSNFSSRTMLPINGNYCSLYLNGEAISDLVIPEGVTAINAYAFMNAYNIESVTIPESVRSIDTYAFALCRNLTSITIPRSVVSIGDYAFSIVKISFTINCYRGSYADSYANRCGYTCVYLDEEYTASGSCGENVSWTLDAEGNLTVYGEGEMTAISDTSVKELAKRITISDGVTKIPDYAFEGYNAATDLIIQKSVTSIGWKAFSGCSSLENVIFTDSSIERNLTIGQGAFSECSSLEYVVLPEGAGIGASVFMNCTSLKSIALPDSYISVGNSLFSGCTALEDVTLSPNTQYIFAEAFKDCSSLKSLRLNAKVRSIAADSFEGCTELTISCSAGSYAESFAIENNIPYVTEEIYIASGSCGDNLEWTINDVYTLTISGEGKMTSRDWYSYKTVIENIVIENGVTTLVDRAFYDCELVTRIELPASIQSIGKYAFSGCTALTYVNIPNGVKTIPAYAFSGCTSLNPVSSIPGTTLPTYGVQLPESVTLIRESAFRGCSSLMSVSAPGVTEIYYDAFINCSALTSVSAPELVTTGDSAFKNCTALQSISGNSALETIGDHTYENCGLSAILTIPASVTTIGEAAFKGCSKVQYVFFNADITEMPDSVFANCTSLVNVVSSVNMTKIGEKAFYGCTALTTPLISFYTVSIGANAYANCSALGEVRIYESTETIGTDAFLNCTSLSIKCCKYSYAESYAVENNIPYSLFDQYITSDGVALTLHDLEGVKDFLIAKGDYSTYREVKDNRIVLVTNAKFSDADEYTYWLSDYGLYTVYIRYTDSSKAPAVLKTELSGPIPELSPNGLQLNLSNLDGVKVIRTAYGDYDTAGDIKRAEGQRSVSASKITSDTYTFQYRENGLVTIAVVYESGYTHIFKHEICKYVPEFVQEGNTVTISDLDNLRVIRYAPGEYSTSSEIKRAEGCVNITPAKLNDGVACVTLEPGVYTFCVQYVDDSYNYYTVTVE